MPNPLPPETTPEWTEQDEREMQGATPSETPEAPDWMAATEVTHDYWRDVLTCRTINALLNANIRLARNAFAMSDDDLLRVRCMGPKGVAQIREAQRRVQGAPVPEWNTDAIASLLLAFAEDHPQRTVGEAMQEAAKRLRELSRSRSAELDETRRSMEPLAASVPNTGTALSEEELRQIGSAKFTRARGVAEREIDWLLAIIDRLSSAPSRGSESDVDPEQAACARCGLPKREHRMGYAAHRCAFYALTVAPLVTESAGGTNG